MLDKYLVIDRETGEEMGVLTCDISNDIFSYLLLRDEDKPWKHPSFYSICKHYNLPVTSDDIKDWVMTRAPEPHNDAILALIETAKLEEYDAYGFFKFNEGQFIQDNFWCKQIEGERVFTYTDLCVQKNYKSHYSHPNGKLK